MSFLDKLRTFLTGPDIPDDVRQQARSAADVAGLKAALDRLCLVNEVKQRELEQEIRALDRLEQSEVELLKSEEEPPTEREKKLILQRILRVRRRIRGLEERIDIHDKNIQVQLNLLGHIQRMESMALQGVTEELITDVHSDAEEAFDKYMSVARLADAAEATDRSPLTNRDRAELKALENELLGVPETAAQETAGVKAPATTESVPHDLAQAEAELDAALDDASEDADDTAHADLPAEDRAALEAAERQAEELRALERELMASLEQPSAPAESKNKDRQTETDAELETE